LFYFGAYKFEKSTKAEFYENIQNIINLNNYLIGITKDLMKAYPTGDYTDLGFSVNDNINYISDILCSVDNTFQQG
jgi:hypothetical protein